MFNVAICDSDKLFCNNLRMHLLEKFAGYFNSIDIYNNSIDIINKIQVNNQIYNIIFTDLFTNEVTGVNDGLTLGEVIRQTSGYDTAFLIYISNNDALASDIVRVRPYAYLKKPLNFKQLDDYNITSLYKLTDIKDFFTFHKGKGIFRLPYNSIMYFENDNRNTIIHCPDNIYRCHIPLSKLNDTISDNNDIFIRPHHSYIINTKYIKQISNDEIILYNGTIIPVSRKYKNTLISKHLSI